MYNSLVNVKNPGSIFRPISILKGMIKLEVYLDILFFTNFAADFLLLRTCAGVLSLKIKNAHLLAAAFLGGMFGTCLFLPDLRALFCVPMAALAAAGMVFLAFGRCDVREFLKRTAVMYAASAIFAGTVFLDMTNFGGIVKNGVFYTSMPRVLWIFGGIYLVSAAAVRMLKKRASSEYPEVVLEFMGKKAACRAFTDTGNGLCDPASGKPVILIEDAVLKKLISPACRAENLTEWVDSDRLRLIPYRTIDRDGVLFGIVLDKISIDGRCVENAIAAVTAAHLKYPVILHAGI